MFSFQSVARLLKRELKLLNLISEWKDLVKRSFENLYQNLETHFCAKNYNKIIVGEKVPTLVILSSALHQISIHTL